MPSISALNRWVSLLSLCIASFWWCCLPVSAQSSEITKVEFYPGTSLNIASDNGVIKVTFADNKEGSVCRNNFGVLEAQVACYMMGYTGDALSISSDQKGKLPTVITNLKCEKDKVGNPGSANFVFSRCTNSGYNLNLQDDCKNNQKDVHVVCLGKKTTKAPVKPTFPTIDCSKTSDYVRLVGGTSQSNGRLEIKNRADNKWYRVCGNFNTFTSREALVFCKILCAKVDETLAKAVLYKYPVGTLDIGLKGLTCPATANDLNQCAATGNFWDGTGCTSIGVVGLECGQLPATPVNNAKPTVACDSNFMTVTWVRANFDNIDQNYIKLDATAHPCNTAPNFDKTQTTTELKVKISIKDVADCKPVVGKSTSGEETTFQFKFIRSYPVVNNMVLADDTFTSTCFLKKKSEGTGIKVENDGVTLPSVTNSFEMSIVLQIYMDAQYTKIWPTPIKVVGKSQLYVKVSQQPQMKSVELVLDYCFVSDMATINAADAIKVDLIKDRCPKKLVNNKVSITKISQHEIGFDFTAFMLRKNDVNKPIYVHCQTSRCGTSEVNCPRGCDSTVLSRKRRNTAFVNSMQQQQRQQKIDVNSVPIFMASGANPANMKLVPITLIIIILVNILRSLSD